MKEFSELVRIMEQCDVCRLAFHDEPFPYLVPLNFGLQVAGETVVLYFHGADAGKKMDLLMLDGRVAFEMDCAHRLIAPENNTHCTMEYESVMGVGRLSVVPENEKRVGLEHLMRHYVNRPSFDFPDAVVRQTTVLRLEVETLTGKRH